MRFLKAFAAATFFISFHLSAQTEYRNQELSIANDNDVYLFLNIDRYYSNGLFLNYRFVPNSYFGDTTRAKRIYDLGLIQKYWTPQNVTLEDPEDYDRPYAGLLTLSLRTAVFPKNDRRLSYGLELGVIGKPSGAQAFQEWYHEKFGFPQPVGWEYQVPNGLVLDLKMEYNRQFFLVPSKLDLITSSSASLGTGFINAMQGVDLRFGRLGNINNSALFNSLIGSGSEKLETHNYFFIGYGLEVVGHNTTIQGHLFGNNDYPYSEDILPLVRHLRIGFATSSKTTTFRLTYNWLSREVDQWAAGRHAYIGMQIDYRIQPRKSSSSRSQ
ncbi:MAG: lipid A deacylase LpxR family protein [Cytophagia bacterium]|nr:lipid A deacylase LpxR family protein [Cytophagia bacterium]